MHTLYLIRHAHPASRPDIPYDRPPGPPLSERGVAEALAAAHFLESSGIERLFVSPLERTLRTAQIIADRLGVTLTADERLAEHRSDETFTQVSDRVKQVLQDIAHSSCRVVGVVTHGSPIRALLQHLTPALDLSAFVFDNGNCAPTAGIWQVRQEEGIWRAALIFRPQLVTV